MLLLALILPLVACNPDSSSIESSTLSTTFDDDVKSDETSDYARHVRGAMGGPQLVNVDDLPQKKRSVDSRDKRGAMVADGGDAPKLVSFDDFMKETRRKKRSVDSRDKRGAMVADGGDGPKLVSFDDFMKETRRKKRSVDKLAHADKSTSMNGKEKTKRSTSSASDENNSRSSDESESENASVDLPQFAGPDNITLIEGSGDVSSDLPQDYTFGIREKKNKTDAVDTKMMDEFEGIEGSGQTVPQYEPIDEPKKVPRWNFSKHAVPEGNIEDTDKKRVRATRWAVFDEWFSSSETTTEPPSTTEFLNEPEVMIESTTPLTGESITETPTESTSEFSIFSTSTLSESTTEFFPSATTTSFPTEYTTPIHFEGSNDDFPILRHVRQAESAAAAVLDVEQPVVNSLLSARRHDSDDSDDRDRRPTSTARPTLTCETVDCIRGTTCVMENGRPTCKPGRGGEEPQRTCRDVNCPRDSRCRMESDPRCRGRDCSEQPVCVRESSRASCNSVQCPIGTRCSLIEEPGCRFNCREIATCLNPCDGVRCPFGSSCRFDGRDAVCAQIALDACLSARCPGGFECRTVQNQARCFPVNTPARTLNPTTTPTPVSCLGQNEEFATCATFCEATCVEKNPPCVLACAAPRCQCASGFYRNHQGVCVFSEQCEFTPTTCAPNEIFNQCSTPCEPRCGQPVQLACPAICGPSKCQCKSGFFRHQSGSCVQQNQCFNG